MRHFEVPPVWSASLSAKQAGALKRWTSWRILQQRNLGMTMLTFSEQIHQATRFILQMKQCAYNHEPINPHE